MNTPLLDRVVQFDEKSREFPIREVTPNTLANKIWRCSTWNDQGQEGACVGFGWGHELAAYPVPFKTDYNYSMGIYNSAKKIDGIPGEDYSGTSVLAGAKVVKSLGHMDEYRWAFGVDDLILAVGNQGPAVIGINWYNDMFNVDANGFIHKSGDKAGGHCILVRGVKLYRKTRLKGWSLDNIDRNRSYFLLRNSWGKSWGVNGDCKITVADMDALLREDGDACIPLIRK